MLAAVGVSPSPVAITSYCKPDSVVVTSSRFAFSTKNASPSAALTLASACSSSCNFLDTIPNASFKSSSDTWLSVLAIASAKPACTADTSKSLKGLLRS